MELQQVIEYIKNPEKVLAVPEMETVIDYCTMWIYQLEEDMMKHDFAVDTKMAELAETHSVAKAEVLIRLEPIYQERKKTERTLKALKSYRQNIRRKRDRVIPR